MFFHLKSYINALVALKEKLKSKILNLHVQKQGYLRRLEGTVVNLACNCLNRGSVGLGRIQDLSEKKATATTAQNYN